MLRDRRLEELLAKAAEDNPGPNPHRKRPLKIHETKRYVRKRMRDPSEFDPRSLRTIDPGRPGRTKLIIGCPRGFYHRGRCTVGTHVQAVLEEK
jgi:hypothetical protein